MLLSEGRYKGSISLKGAMLDYEQVTAFKMTLVAKDRGGLVSTADVEITIQDVQDEAPRFLNAPFSVTVNESTPTDTTVLNVLVRDGDASLSLRRPLKVEILRDHKRYFTLKHTSDDTWSLMTTQTAIDREDPEILLAGGVYEIGLRAVELINGRETSDVTLANVTCVIHDINDQVRAACVQLLIGEELIECCNIFPHTQGAVIQSAKHQAHHTGGHLERLSRARVRVEYIAKRLLFSNLRLLFPTR